MELELRFGIMGTANIARKAVIPAITNSDHAKVVSVASGSGRAKEFAEEMGIKRFHDSYEAMLEDDSIDAVYIPLPNTLHKKWTIEAARKGKHVLCEKPAAITVEDAMEMVQACEDNGVTFMEAFMYQFHPQHNVVRDVIASGEIGDVKHMRSTFSFFLGDRPENIRLNRELGGGSIWDVGCYCIHSSRHILGNEPTKVYVEGNVPAEVGVDMSAAGILTFANGVTASFDCSFERQMSNMYEVLGTKGSIKVPYAYRPDAPGASGIVQVTTSEGEVREETVNGEQYTLMIDHFAQCIATGETPSYSGEATVNNLKAIEACYRSLDNNSPIEMA
ncbi:Gfo/Idh/MocA family protein [Pseudalkalibacillus hwajinpoensis]|uniref:Gfo/Idh/MocA family oxidoreductase n=1 Tax=Guptibacillus hwajinpoensis TaxID=208199 RepID=A0A4U1MI08_9BACL|nr:Gfo/Idh/MocA family oxidoreductase [Pseudalkalibacillus hwajinpoensis]TKD70959.1 Gfo/Idh/MocA family oxidoreductase [Pseudalkalibacillus hwajinpoensis]